MNDHWKRHGYGTTPGLVHRIVEWEGPHLAEVLQCGADYEAAPDEDMALADGKHPELGDGRTPCRGCYPEEYD